MLCSVSPYELLRASKPRQTPTVVTPYDLYSHSQQPMQADNAVPSPDAQLPGDVHAPAQEASGEKRTHYIAQIHARHGAAQRYAAYTDLPIR